MVHFIHTAARIGTRIGANDWTALNESLRFTPNPLWIVVVVITGGERMMMVILKDIERYGASRNSSNVNHRKMDRLLAKINIVV